MSRTDTELVIGFKQEDRFSCASLQEPENLLVVREAAQALQGQPLQVIIKALNDDTALSRDVSSGGAMANQNTVGDLQQQKRETIQAVLDIFDGRIIM